MCNHLGTMSKILNFLILFVLLLKCSFPENRASNNQEKKDVVVTLSCTNKEKGLITIKNNLDEAIIINKFINRIEMFILERKLANGDIQKLQGSPPPMPPKNLEEYNITLSKAESFVIPIHFYLLENTPEAKIKIRTTITYHTMKNEKGKKACSDWVVYEKQLAKIEKD